MSFVKTQLSRSLPEEHVLSHKKVSKSHSNKKKANKVKKTNKSNKSKNTTHKHIKKRKHEDQSHTTSKIKKVDEKNMQDIQIRVRRISGEGQHHVWIHMVGKGNVRMEYVMEKMEELQKHLDNIAKKPMLQFTFVFDFRHLYDFADFATLYKFGAFMNKNKQLFERRLRMSYLLLRYWTWRASVKTLFFAFPPTKEVEYEIPEDIDTALCNS
jgi:ACT domain-containing protein